MIILLPWRVYTAKYDKYTMTTNDRESKICKLNITHFEWFHESSTQFMAGSNC